MKGLSDVFVSCDFRQFFDSFDNQCIWKFLLHAGDPAHLAELTFHLYTSMVRTMRKETALSPPSVAFNWFGPGDIMSPLPALLLVSWQFKVVEQMHPGELM